MKHLARCLTHTKCLATISYCRCYNWLADSPAPGVSSIIDPAHSYWNNPQISLAWVLDQCLLVFSCNARLLGWQTKAPPVLQSHHLTPVTPPNPNSQPMSPLRPGSLQRAHTTDSRGSIPRAPYWASFIVLFLSLLGVKFSQAHGRTSRLLFLLT